MQNLVFRVEDEGAERLYNYLLAYKKIVGKNHFTEKEENKENVTPIVITALEQIKATS